MDGKRGKWRVVADYGGMADETPFGGIWEEELDGAVEDGQEMN